MSNVSWLREKYYLFKLVDKRNQALWQRVQKSHQVSIQINPESNYGVTLRKGTAIIHVLHNKLDPASFAHELLHIDLDAKGIKTGVFLRVSVKTRPRLVALLPENLIEWLPNVWEHIKMLPVFLAMGYKPDQFISDYEIDKGDDFEITFVELTLRSGDKYSALALEHYIARYFAIVACSNKNFQYDAALQRLGALDPDLYNVLSDFTGKWKLFEINDPAAKETSRHLVDQFIESLLGWTTGKYIS